jgi:endoribonuclease Dicer
MNVPESTQSSTLTTRSYQQEMLEESLQSNIIIALDTGSGKTHIAVLRMKIEVERQPTKVQNPPSIICHHHG